MMKRLNGRCMCQIEHWYGRCMSQIEQRLGHTVKGYYDQYASKVALNAIRFHPNEAQCVTDAVETLCAVLTAESVAESVGCVPFLIAPIESGRYRIMMDIHDEQAFHDAVFCVKKVDHGEFGYRATGLWKEDGQPVAIISKAGGGT